MKRFLVILGVTVLVWLGVSMAEEQTYPMQVRVEMTGYDTVRYAMVEADTVLPLQVSMDGFSAFMASLRRTADTLRVVVPEGQSAVAVSSLGDRWHRVIPGARRVTSSVDSLRVVLVQRASRSYRPSIDDVNFTFSEQYGLYGEPTVTPSEVVLYGPEEALAQIDQVRVAAASFGIGSGGGNGAIKASGTYRLPLVPIWKEYADVRPSCSEVEIYLPVEAYVERDYSVPIRVLDADSTVTLRLYPPTATVRAWVAQRDLYREPDFTVAVNYSDVVSGEARIAPRLVEFPAYVRPRNVEPAEVQVVVIK